MGDGSIYYAENWPNGLAPAEWWVKMQGLGVGDERSPYTYWSWNAQLWVPERCEALTGKSSLGALWWTSGFERTLEGATRRAIDAADELVRQRDGILYATPGEAWRLPGLAAAR